MTEEGQGVITLKDNKNKTTNNEENKNEKNQKEDNYNQEVLDSKGNLETNPPKNEQLELNKKDIYELSSEAIEKLGISPCQICQSNNYSIFIPETAYNASNQNEKPLDQTIENENQDKKKNLEEDYIKPVKNQNIYFPILICKQNHQICLICNQSPHINTLCSQSNIDYNNAVSKLDIIKENFPEKANICESMKESASTLNKNNSDCNINCCCILTTIYKVFGIIFLFFGWIIYTFLLLDCVFIIFAYAAMLLMIGLFISFCCSCICNRDTTVEDQDKGDHILRVTTVDENKKIENEEIQASMCSRPLEWACELSLKLIGYSISCYIKLWKFVCSTFSNSSN